MTVPCRARPDVFFSEDGRDIAAAKTLCQGCPLSQYEDCRREGWRHESGVFGGLSGDDRRALDPKRYAATVAANQQVSIDRDVRMVLGRPDTVQGTAIRLSSLGLSSAKVAKLTGTNANNVRYWLAQWRKNLPVGASQ